MIEIPVVKDAAGKARLRVYLSMMSGSDECSSTDFRSVECGARRGVGVEERGVRPGRECGYARATSGSGKRTQINEAGLSETLGRETGALPNSVTVLLMGGEGAAELVGCGVASWSNGRGNGECRGGAPEHTRAPR